MNPLRVAATAAGLVIGATAAGGAAEVQSPPPFRTSVAPLTAAERAAMTPSVWRPGCPVDLAALRVVRVTHHTFDGRVRTGRLVVHRDVAGQVTRIMRSLYSAGVPIRWIVPIERFGGSDFRSIEADNTSAFNCRYVDGTRRWSDHAYGRAIDINPIENPYVSGGRTSHPASVRFLVRRPGPGVAIAGGPLVRAFEAERWSWGGRWSGVKDYQHFGAPD